LLDNDREISKNATAVTKYWLRQQACLHGNRGTMFSVWSVLRRYKQDSWSNELIKHMMEINFYMTLEGLQYSEI
jgi:hypothetical protein